jgi:DNA adenine methylase
VRHRLRAGRRVRVVDDHPGESGNSLRRKHAALGRVRFLRADFLGVPPRPVRGVIYCDPPYAGTTGYRGGGVSAFDHARFWYLCRRWVDCGARVFVSEYRVPVVHSVIATWQRPVTLTRFKALGVRRACELLAEIC